MKKIIYLSEKIAKNSEAIKANYLQKHLEDYYSTVNQGKLEIHAFVLAKNEVERLRNERSINYWYRQLKLSEFGGENATKSF